MMNYNPKNPHISTFTGKKFHFLDFGPKDIYIEDIAHSLSNICRFNGHCKKFFSVAEHSLNCYWSSRIPWALLHDAAEAYIGDICSPLKDHISAWHMDIKIYEKDLLRVIGRRFNLEWPIPDNVWKTDKEMLDIEIKTLMDSNEMNTLSPQEAELIFLKTFSSVIEGVL